MVERIAHIGIAVKDMEAAVELFAKLFNRKPEKSEEVYDQKVRTVLFDFDGTGIELLEPTVPESAIGRFIERRGAGVHHVSFVVDDIKTEMERLTKLGFELVDNVPRDGADGYLVAFLHPRSTNGVLIEISQKRSEQER